MGASVYALFFISLLKFSQPFALADADDDDVGAVTQRIPFEQAIVRYHRSRYCITNFGQTYCVRMDREPGSGKEIAEMYNIWMQGFDENMGPEGAKLLLRQMLRTLNNGTDPVLISQGIKKGNLSQGVKQENLKQRVKQEKPSQAKLNQRVKQQNLNPRVKQEQLSQAKRVKQENRNQRVKQVKPSQVRLTQRVKQENLGQNVKQKKLRQMAQQEKMRQKGKQEKGQGIKGEILRLKAKPKAEPAVKWHIAGGDTHAPPIPRYILL